jgi:uncharacterized membrane protein
MIVFHLFYDLNYFKFIKIDLKCFFWWIQPKIIVSMFLIASGMSIQLLHGKGIKWNKVIKRFFKLSSLALIITIITYNIFPSNWIFFGVIHNVALSSVVSLFFINKPRLALFTAISFLLMYGFGLEYYLINFPMKSVDHVPFFPWFNCFLIGIYLAHKKVHLLELKSIPLIEYLGRYSLQIYFIHQGVLFSLIFGLHKVFHT